MWSRCLPKSTPRFMDHNFPWDVVSTRADWSTSVKWQAGNSLNHFENGWERLTIRCFSISFNVTSDFYRIYVVVYVIDPRWRHRVWRFPRPGRFFRSPLPCAVQNGGSSASGYHLGWPDSGTRDEVIQDGDRKRKGRHFAPRTQWGSKKPPYTTSVN